MKITEAYIPREVRMGYSERIQNQERSIRRIQMGEACVVMAMAAVILMAIVLIGRM